MNLIHGCKIYYIYVYYDEIKRLTGRNVLNYISFKSFNILLYIQSSSHLIKWKLSNFPLNTFQGNIS